MLNENAKIGEVKYLISSELCAKPEKHSNESKLMKIQNISSKNQSNL